MKIMLLLGVVALIGVGLLFTPSKTEVVQQEKVVEKEVMVDALEKAIMEAQEAKKVEIEAIAQTAYDEAYNQEMKKVELEVVKSFNAKLGERQVELEKETKVY